MGTVRLEFDLDILAQTLGLPSDVEIVKMGQVDDQRFSRCATVFLESQRFDDTKRPVPVQAKVLRVDGELRWEFYRDSGEPYD